MPKKNKSQSTKLEQAIEELQEYMRKSKRHQRSLEEILTKHQTARHLSIETGEYSANEEMLNELLSLIQSEKEEAVRGFVEHIKDNYDDSLVYSHLLYTFIENFNVEDKKSKVIKATIPYELFSFIKKHEDELCIKNVEYRRDEIELELIVQVTKYKPFECKYFNKIYEGD